MITDADISMYSDLYKSVYGVRPQNCYSIVEMSEEELREEFASLQQQLEEDEKYEAKYHLNSQRQWEKCILKMQENYNITRKTAIRWLFSAEEDDEEEILYSAGICMDFWPLYLNREERCSY